MTPESLRRIRWASAQEDRCHEAAALEDWQIADLLRWPLWTWELGPLQLFFVSYGRSAQVWHVVVWPEDHSRN